MADAIVTLLEFVTLVGQRREVRDSARVVLYWRFHPNGDFCPFDPHGIHNQEEAKFEQGWFRALVFFLGALPRVIKVVGLQGVPGTQALCSAYLASFPAVELLVYLAGKERDDFDHAIVRPKNITILALILRLFGAVSQTALWYYLLAEGLKRLRASALGAIDGMASDLFKTILFVDLLLCVVFLPLIFWWMMSRPLFQLSHDDEPRLPRTAAECRARVTATARITGAVLGTISFTAIVVSKLDTAVNLASWMFSSSLLGPIGMVLDVIWNFDVHDLELIEEYRLLFYFSS